MPVARLFLVLMLHRLAALAVMRSAFPASTHEPAARPAPRSHSWIISRLLTLGPTARSAETMRDPGAAKGGSSGTGIAVSSAMKTNPISRINGDIAQFTEAERAKVGQAVAGIRSTAQSTYHQDPLHGPEGYSRPATRSA
jgi:hypothetical protein